MAVIGNKEYPQQGPFAAFTESTLFNFVLAGSPTSYFGAQFVRVISDSGCIDYQVKVFSPTGSEIARKRSSVNAEDGYVEINLGYFLINQGQNIQATVEHGDSANHYFSGWLVGLGQI